MKARFFNDLFVGLLPKRRVIVDRLLHYYSPTLERLTGDGHVYVQPGFVCDLTSLRFLGLCSRGDWDRAAVIHDLLFKAGKHAGTRLSKGDCDDVFREAMIALRTHPVRVFLYREGVRFLAWPAWLAHRRRDRKQTINQP
jgi:hypothetical protein